MADIWPSISQVILNNASLIRKLDDAFEPEYI